MIIDRRLPLIRCKLLEEKITEYVGTLHGQDISNELQNKTTVAITEPTLLDAVIIRNAAHEVVIRNGQPNIQSARRVGEAMLQLAVDEGLEARAPMELATLQNEIAAGELELSEPVPVQLTDSEKTQNNNDWRTFCERNASLAKHPGQTYSLILGQCSQLLKDKMKQDAKWNARCQFDPLTLYRLIGKKLLRRQKTNTRLPPCTTRKCRSTHSDRKA